jgi:hypothetical protein
MSYKRSFGPFLVRHPIRLRTISSALQAREFIKALNSEERRLQYWQAAEQALESSWVSHDRERQAEVTFAEALMKSGWLDHQMSLA